MKLALIVARGRNGIIGGDGALPWRIRDDLKWFKSVTMNKPMIMGRKTFESIGKPLPGRDSIILTRRPDFLAAGAYLVRTLKGAIVLGTACAAERGEDEICIIGGGEIYAQFLPRADRIYLTEVDAEPDGDTAFPPIDEGAWQTRKEGACEQSAENDFACEFFILDRKRR